MTEIVRFKTNPRRGRANLYNGILYVGGIAAHDRRGDITAQTREALEKVDQVLAEVGTDKRNVLSAQIWMKDIVRDFAEMNVTWDAWVDPDAMPARATSQCLLAADDALIEIIVTAVVPD